MPEYLPSWISLVRRNRHDRRLYGGHLAQIDLNWVTLRYRSPLSGRMTTTVPLDIFSATLSAPASIAGTSRTAATPLGRENGIDQWILGTLSGTVTTNPYVFTISSNTTITANFVLSGPTTPWAGPVPVWRLVPAPSLPVSPHASAALFASKKRASGGNGPSCGGSVQTRRAVQQDGPLSLS